MARQENASASHESEPQAPNQTGGAESDTEKSAADARRAGQMAAPQPTKSQPPDPAPVLATTTTSPEQTEEEQRQLRPFRRRSWQSVWAVAGGVIVLAVIIGVILNHDLAWVGIVLLAAGAAATAEAAASGKSTAFRELVFAERPPFSVTASLKAEHLLRLVSSADPYHQEVVPVSGAHRIQLVVEVRSEHPVTIRSFRPVVMARRPTRKGEAGVVAGILPDGHFEVLLDADPPRLQGTVSASGATNATLPVTLEPGAEPLVIVLTPRTDDYEVDWRVELDWSAQDKEGVNSVGLGRKPFRVTAEAGW